jgi:hypothetical protein
MHLEKQTDAAGRVLGAFVSEPWYWKKPSSTAPLTIAVRSHSSSAGLRTVGKYLAV